MRSAGLELTEAQVEELTEATEGWAAGLYLAALSLRAQPGRDPGREPTFKGADWFVADYFRLELLSYLDDDDVTFLTRSSVLGEMSRSAMRRGPGGQWLRYPAGASSSRNLFVVPLDQERRCYRYHHLFKDVPARSSSGVSPTSPRAPRGVRPTGARPTTTSLR